MGASWRFSNENPNTWGLIGPDTLHVVLQWGNPNHRFAFDSVK
jgi:hypothetical protein